MFKSILANRFIPIMVLLCLFPYAHPQAQVITKPVLDEATKAKMAKDVVPYFWDKAVDSKGNVIRAKGKQERERMPVPMKDLSRIIDNAVPTGYAMFCGVKWETYYQAYMKLERVMHKWNEVENAFIGMVFGYTQQMVTSSLAARMKCYPKMKIQVQTDINNGFSTIKRMTSKYLGITKSK